MIQAALRRDIESSRPMRSKISLFDFNNKCLFCEEVITEDYKNLQKKLPLSRRNNLFKVTLREMADSILTVATSRNDEWGRKLEERIMQVKNLGTDLVAVNAEYHQKCCKLFFSTQRNSGQKRGRPCDPEIEDVMEVVNTTLEKNSDECQFPLAKLLGEIDEDRRPQI